MINPLTTKHATRVNPIPQLVQSRISCTSQDGLAEPRVACVRMGQWIFAEYAWTMFVRADLEAQVLLSHLVYRKSSLDMSAHTAVTVRAVRIRHDEKGG